MPLLVACTLAALLSPQEPQEHWAYRPPVRRELPAAARAPIDAFLAAKWPAEGLEPAEPAAREVLARRVFLDVIGLPPTVGFIGKWFLFSAAMEQGQFVFVLVAAINSAVALYYYLLVIRQAYFTEPVSAAPLRPSFLTLVAAGATTGLVVAMGAVPGWFYQMSDAAVAALTG